MRIVQIEDFFHPEAGYQVNILSKYLSMFGNEVYIFTSEMKLIPNDLLSFFTTDDLSLKDKKYEDDYNVKIIRFPLKNYISSRSIYKKDIFKSLKTIKPDVVFVHGNDTYIAIQLINKYLKHKFPIVTDSHMLKMASINKLHGLFTWYYRNFITKKIIKYQIPVIRTQNDDYVQKELGIPIELSPYISLGSDTLLFYKDYTKRMLFRSKHNIPNDEFVIIYAGKLNEAKGSMLLANVLLKKFDFPFTVIIIGNTSGIYGNELEYKFCHSTNRILRFNTQKYSDLAIFYQASDLAIFPKQCSLSFYDVQACGLPVLSEDNNINIERCSHNNGWTFLSNNVDDMAQKINSIIKIPKSEYEIISENSIQYIKTNFDYLTKAREYEMVLSEAIKQKRID